MSFSNGAEPQEPQNSNWIFLQASDPTADADIRNSSASRLTLRPDQDTKSPVGLESRLKYQFGFNAYRQPGELAPTLHPSPARNGWSQKGVSKCSNQKEQFT